MKTLLSILLVMLTTLGSAQNITGDWYGILEVQGMKLEIVFHISETENGYTTTMDSPDQNAYGIPVSSTTFEDNVLHIKAPNVPGMEYKGTLQEDTINGTFFQGGMGIPLNLSREKPEGQKVNRPQEPQKPYPFYAEEVNFDNSKDGVTLAGTLTLPSKEGDFPAVILISGSGPQDRNEEILGHKPFLVISDYLTRNGIAVLRYDDRGAGASTGDFSTATSLDFAEDVKAALEYLRSREEINAEEIGLIGHSEGAMIAPMVAAEDKEVGFLVLLAGTGLRGDKILLRQQELVAKAYGESEENIEISRLINEGVFDILNTSSPENLEKDLRAFLSEQLDKGLIYDFPAGMDQEEFINNQTKTYMNPWMHFFLTYDPAEALEKVNAPVLALNGERDLQVTPENLQAIEEALKKGGNDQVTIKEYPGLNHLFQESGTGSPAEYAEIEQTFSPEVLEDMKNWILNITGNN